MRMSINKLFTLVFQLFLKNVLSADYLLFLRREQTSLTSSDGSPGLLFFHAIVFFHWLPPHLSFGFLWFPPFQHFWFSTASFLFYLVFYTGCHPFLLWFPALQHFWFSTASFLIYLVFYTGCHPFFLTHFYSGFQLSVSLSYFSYVFHLLFFLSVFHLFSIFFYFPLVSTSFSISVAQLHHKNSDLIDLTGQDIHLYY